MQSLPDTRVFPSFPSMAANFVKRLESTLKSESSKTKDVGRIIHALEKEADCEATKIKGLDSFNRDAVVFKCTDIKSRKAIAVKVHSEIWANCRRIYNNPELLAAVNALPHTSNIHSTFVSSLPASENSKSTEPFRVVIYDFVPGQTLQQKMQDSEIDMDAIEKIVDSSLSTIDLWFVGIPADIVIRESDQKPIITDWDEIMPKHLSRSALIEEPV